ncbi:MAG: hypothetical protein AAFW70_21225 [Cyanobacteria bacterium J06635_10]
MLNYKFVSRYRSSNCKKSSNSSLGSSTPVIGNDGAGSQATGSMGEGAKRKAVIPNPLIPKINPAIFLNVLRLLV